MPAPAKAGVIKTADWIIDLGPEGGVKGGEIVAEGTPEQVVKEGQSFTGRYLAPLLRTREAGAKREEVAAEGSVQPKQDVHLLIDTQLS